jgi:SAM-dependent methyltransferase
MLKLTWPAPERNKQPILEVLKRVLPASGTLLEISSGTGQHAEHFARELSAWIVEPSEYAADQLASIEARVVDAGLPNLRAPRQIDVRDSDWKVGTVDAIFNANLIHIAPWDAAVGLTRGAARHLRAGGLLVVYGPFRVGGSHTAPSNQAFDADLRRRDPSFGVRDLEAFVELAAALGLSLQERVAMPANNLTLVFARD